MGRQTMGAALQGEGYNATPVWTMVGSTLSRPVGATPSGPERRSNAAGQRTSRNRRSPSLWTLNTRSQVPAEASS
jgi:hypothetical protein